MATRKPSEEPILAREVGVSTYTMYSWKATYGGMEPGEAARLYDLEHGNSRLGD